MSVTDCPKAAQYRSSPQTVTLHKACEILGGVAQLANLLGVTSISLVRWMEGDEPTPDRVFLACVDIVMSYR